MEKGRETGESNGFFGSQKQKEVTIGQIKWIAKQEKIQKKWGK